VLDRAAARHAVAGLAQQLGLDTLACAEGIVRVANAEMVRALRVMTVQQGIDPRRFALLAFGGAGPLHAAAIADELGMRTILCPRASGVLSALGLAAADRRATEQRTVLLAGEGLSDEALAQARDELAETACATLGGDAGARLDVAYDVRYRGQAHELTVRDLDRATVADVRTAFEALHDERYGYRDADTPIEVVTVRATARVPGPELDLAAGAGEGLQRSRRAVVFSATEHDAEVLRGEPSPGDRIAGPAVCELPEATLAVPPGWHGTVDDAGTVVLQRGDDDA
jgi:N-methylhydantoinase A